MSLGLPFDLTRPIFRWGPVPGRFFYTSAFAEVNYKYFCQKYLGEQWPEALFLFKDGRMVWLNDDTDLRQAGRRVFLLFMMPRAARERIYQEWKNTIGELAAIFPEITPEHVATLSDEQLKGLWERFHTTYINFWIPSIVPELSNYGSDGYLIERLQAYVTDETEINKLMEVLSAPTQLSFYKEEEIELSQAADLAAHRARYFWLKNSYAGTHILPLEFFAERKKEMTSDLEKNAVGQLRAAAVRKKEIQHQYKLPDEIMDIGQAIAVGIGWQDERKKYIFMVLHYQDIMLAEIARRYGYDCNELHNAWYFEISSIFGGKDLRSLFHTRQAGFGVKLYKQCQELTSEEVDYYWSVYANEKTSEQSTELKGVVASTGKKQKVEGKVRIVLDPLKAEAFKTGEILVAPMTSPEYIFAMQKAAAIITDTGGLTSHAAIVSRELGIPCLVGTKFASTVFKNGDSVQVDASMGIVKKIS